ncbi:hypothetical protein PAN31117_02291 [Pandoraea anapnoica]|uniref:DNA methylase adenine-specific domain-containing protein n=2 Tax=Pandoraea anapnoica TaxID=2508301 RepID=A0A5E5A039_9BURK|nr:hypothetical protein PAN31117_02291 [Pandoraea anapnoica]
MINPFRDLVSTLSSQGVPDAYRTALSLLAETQDGDFSRSSQFSLTEAYCAQTLEATKANLVEVLDWISLSDTARRRGEAMLTPDIAQLLAHLAIEGKHSRAIVLQDPLCLVAARLASAGVHVEQFCPGFEVPKLCAVIANAPAWSVVEPGEDDSQPHERVPTPGAEDGVLIAALPLIPGVSGGAHAKQLPYAASDDLEVTMRRYGAAVARFIVLVPSSMLYRTGKAAEFRRDLLNQGLVEAVLELPNGTTPLATHQYSILVLRSPRSRAVGESVFVMNLPEREAPATRGRGRRVEVESGSAVTARIIDRCADGLDTSRLITYGQILDTGSLLPRMLLGEVGADACNDKGRVALRDVARILRPTALPVGTSRPRVAVTTEGIIRAFPYVRYVELMDDEHAPAKAHEVVIHLEAGDIIIVAKGTVGEVGLVEWSTNEPILLPNSCLVLRANRVADANALYLYFKSPAGIERLRSIVTGSTVRNIRISDLGGLAVPSVSAQARELAESTLKNINEKTAHIQQLDEERAQLLEKSLEEIAKLDS